MKAYIALFFVTLAVLQCSSAPASDSVESKESGQEKASERTRIVCEPETVFKVSCNTCHCGKDGTAMACTRKACNEEIFNEDGSLKDPQPITEAAAVDESASNNSSEEKKIVCEPGTGFRKECNHCSCAKDGTGYACTRMACPPGVFNDDGSLKEQETASNVDVVIEDANSDSIIVEATSESTSNVTTAIVIEAATEAATEVPSTIPKIQWGPLWEQGTPCPDKIFYSECNQCACLENGKTAACTLMLCDAFRNIYEMQSKNATEVA